MCASIKQATDDAVHHLARVREDQLHGHSAVMRRSRGDQVAADTTLMSAMTAGPARTWGVVGAVGAHTPYAFATSSPPLIEAMVRRKGQWAREYIAPATLVCLSSGNGRGLAYPVNLADHVAAQRWLNAPAHWHASYYVSMGNPKSDPNPVSVKVRWTPDTFAILASRQRRLVPTRPDSHRVPVLSVTDPDRPDTWPICWIETSDLVENAVHTETYRAAKPSSVYIGIRDASFAPDKLNLLFSDYPNTVVHTPSARVAHQITADGHARLVVEGPPHYFRTKERPIRDYTTY